MRCKFVVGQRVVCIKRGLWNTVYGIPEPMPDCPRSGEVCEISQIYLWEGFIVLRLIGYGNWGYGANRFRPLAEPDISVFETLLADINAGKVKPVGVPP